MRNHWISLTTLVGVLSMLAACGGAGGGGALTVPTTLTAVSPLEGTSAGGTEVTLRGTGFTDPTREIVEILFGEEPAAAWEVIDDTTIVCTAPSGSIGSTIITLWGADTEEPMLTGGYRYVALTLYVADGANAENPGLYRIDLDTGRIRRLGPTGYPVAALATRPDGWIFAVEDGPLRRLILIDPVSGAGRPIARLRDGATGEAPPDIVDLTFVGSRLLGRTAAGQLVEIDMALGDVTLLDPTPGPDMGSGLAADPEGSVYLTPESGASIATWDPDTGESVEGPPLESEAFDAIAVLDGMVFGVQVDPEGGSEPLLVRINPHTGDLEILGPLPPNVESVTGDF